MKNLSLIACISQDGGLGKDGGLLWHIKADMKYFRDSTIHKTVVMGAKTYLSIGKPLPSRKNIVLSHGNFPEVTAAGGQVVHNIEELDRYISETNEEIVVIGGAKLFDYYLPRANVFHLTEVDGTQPADTFFPHFDRSQYRKNIIMSGMENDINFTISTYEKLNPESENHLS